MFKELRIKKGLTTKYASQKLGISLSTFYKMEQSQYLPSTDILLKMKDLYKCTYEDIMNAYKLSRRIYDERKSKRNN